MHGGVTLRGNAHNATIWAIVISTDQCMVVLLSQVKPGVLL